MPKTITLQLTPKQSADAETYTALACRQMGIRRSDIALVRVVKRSIDARRSPVKVNLSLEVFVDQEPQPGPIHFDYPDVSKATEVVVVGSGPAGLFASLRLIELGLKPILLERGKEVLPRKRDIALINRNLEIDPDSNYAFGAGGAGTFSDGKLFTRSKKRGDYNKALQTLVFHGATPEILYEAHPHIGTDKLPRIISNICQTIITSGGEIHFSSKVTGFEIDHARSRIRGVWVGDKLIEGAAVVLATGHSAKDIYHTLHHDGVRLEAKGFAMGVRIEHQQRLIDSIQYHMPERGEYLPAASYALVNQVEGRGVYSFCMCPGGFVVNASSEEGRLAVNGMSYYKRGGENANSAIIVSVTPEDFPEAGPLGGIEFQRQLEEKAFELGNGKIPVQLYGDFVKNQISVEFGNVNPQICGLYAFANLRGLMTEEMNQAFIEGMTEFGRKVRGFDRADAILAGIESRTSSPLRIVRDDNLESNVKGLYPCGEGAGYAGGITSAAMDGLKVAEALIMRYNRF